MNKEDNKNKINLETKLRPKIIDIFYTPAGLVCSLPARTGVLAAANPVGGHYNKAKTVSENLKMNPALLSRFDLVRKYFRLNRYPKIAWHVGN